MKNKILYPLLFLIFSLSFAKNYAQTDDFGVILNEEFNISFVPNWNFIYKNEFRFDNNVSKVERIATKFDVAYLFWKKQCSVGAGSNFFLDFRDIQYLSLRYRLNLNFIFDKKLNQFQLIYRLRYQNTFSDSYNEIQFPHEMLLRQRLKFEYSFEKIPLALFVSSELFFSLNKQNENGLESIRNEIGTDITMLWFHVFRLYIRNDRNLSSFKPDNIYYLGLSYILKY